MTASHNLRAYLLLTFTTWCWGLNAIISRLAVGEISPMQLVTVRWLGVVLILAVIARDNIVRDWPILRRHLPFLCLMGSCGFTAFNALFYVAGHHTSAINIGILQGSIPIFVLLGSLLVLRQPISLIQGSGVAVTLLGVVIVASRGDPGELLGMSVNRGDLFIVIACFFYAAYSIGLSRRPNVSALGFFTAVAAVAWIVSLPLVAIRDLPARLDCAHTYRLDAGAHGDAAAILDRADLFYTGSQFNRPEPRRGIRQPGTGIRIDNGGDIPAGSFSVLPRAGTDAGSWRHLVIRDRQNQAGTITAANRC